MTPPGHPHGSSRTPEFGIGGFLLKGVEPYEQNPSWRGLNAHRLIHPALSLRLSLPLLLSRTCRSRTCLARVDVPVRFSGVITALHRLVNAGNPSFSISSVPECAAAAALQRIPEQVDLVW